MYQISNIYKIVPNFKIIFCDLWGVIHDGSNLYPGVKEFLIFCQRQNIKVIFVSNAPRRSSEAIKILEKFQIERELYLAMVTSGETFYHEATEDFSYKRCFIIAPNRDLNQLDGLNFNFVEDLNEAEFIVNMGYYNSEFKNEGLETILKAAAKLNLPMYCLNPDLIVVKQTGETLLCAGDLAQKYQALGGEVIYYGKPYQNIYQFAYDIYANATPKQQICMLGDSMHTDIKGANDFGIKSCLVLQGILNKTLSENFENNMNNLIKQYKAQPDFLINDLLP